MCRGISDDPTQRWVLQWNPVKFKRANLQIFELCLKLFQKRNFRGNDRLQVLYWALELILHILGIMVF